MDLDFRLHAAQAEIYHSPARFKVVPAGRRFGKTYLARVMLVVNAMMVENHEGKDLCGGNINVAYVAPTFSQARKIMWQPLINTLHTLKPSSSETDGVIRLPNGRRIYISGADNYDNLRGQAFSFVVLDEYAQMNPSIWEDVLRPTLIDAKGGALFIGTPDGKNHFYDLYLKAEKRVGWETFTFGSNVNPHIPAEELEDIKLDMSDDSQAQELRASFTAGGGKQLKEHWIHELEKCPGKDTEFYIAVDLAGFEVVKKKHGKTLDETAIAIVEAGAFGWYCHDIIYGRWDVRETAIRILRACQKYKPLAVGIEKGVLKQAVDPYLLDNMKRLMVFPPILEVTHGNKNKQGRINWSLQGRLEQGRLTFKPGGYMQKFREQAADFPNPLAHDDLLDALSYIDQLVNTNYLGEDSVVDNFEYLDDIAGY